MRKSPAAKAADTRRARKAFQDRYGKVALNVIRMILLGTSDLTTQHYLWVNTGCWHAPASLAAFKANLNRAGTYRTMAHACNF